MVAVKRETISWLLAGVLAQLTAGLDGGICSEDFTLSEPSVTDEEPDVL